MKESSLIDKIPSKTRSNISGTITVSSFINNIKMWNREKLKSCLPNYIVDKTMSIPLPMNYISNKIIWRFISYGNSLKKTIIRANNDQIPPHSRQKISNHIWKLKVIPKLKLFVWKLIQ